MNCLDQILQEINKFETIIVHRHQRPDPDALGSQVGLAEILRASFPEKEIYQVGETISGLNFLATMDKVSEDTYQNALVIVTDTANSPRISDSRYTLGKYLIKMDHHPNDDSYGDLVWVNIEASSCSEMIYDFYQYHQNTLTMNDKAARLLYAGIVGDTGRFLYPSTTAHTLEVSAQLMTYNFDAATLNRELEEISLKVAKLAGYLYQQLEVDQNGAAKIILPQKILAEFGIDDSETASIVPLPGMIDQVLAWGIFVEQPEGYYRVRLRSKGPTINELAKEFHGGGHPLASGATVKNTEEIAALYNKLQLLCQTS